MIKFTKKKIDELVRMAWIESGMERMRSELEAAEVQAAYERKTREAAEVKAANERKTREAAEVRANEAEKRAQDLEAELNLLKQQLNHKD